MGFYAYIVLKKKWFCFKISFHYTETFLDFPYADILEMPTFDFLKYQILGLYKYIGISYYRDVTSHHYDLSES